MQDSLVPDNVDYEWLGWLLEHPEQWSEEDFATARSMLADQIRAVEEAHPRDRRTRQSVQEVVDSLEVAIQRYLVLPR